MAPQMSEFVGYDSNSSHIKAAQRKGYPHCRFETYDLSNGLPQGDPGLVIIRNPNFFIFDPNEETQTHENPVWKLTLEKLRSTYREARVIITGITLEEIQKSAQWLGVSPDQINPDQFKTHFAGNFDTFGTLKLPIAADSYYFIM